MGTDERADLPREQCQDPAVLEAHRPHRWAPVRGGHTDGSVQWRYCDGRARPERPAGLLTHDEHAAVEAAGRVAVLLGRIAGDGPSRRADLAELCAAVHAVQNAVLAQAAARAYPDRYRLMGATVVVQDEALPRGTQVTVDGSALTAPPAGDFDAEVYAAERCRDPWTPDAHPPHRWRPADDPTWRYCDGLTLLHDGLAVRRCRDGGAHGAHRWGTRIGDPPVPAGLATDAPGLAWCPGQSAEKPADDPLEVSYTPVPGVPDAELARVCRHAAVEAQEQGRQRVTLPAWLLGRLAHAAASDAALLPFVVEAEPGSTGDGVARTLRRVRWDCFDRVQLDRRSVDLVLDALDGRELAEGDVWWFPAQRVHYTVVVDVEGAPHLRESKVGEIGGDA